MKRRLRASFLLKLVVALVSLGLLLLVLSLLALHPVTLATLAAVGVFWFLAIELNLLPDLLEALLLRRAAKFGRIPGHSIWFVDLEAEAHRERDRLRKQTENNPTIR